MEGLYIKVEENGKVVDRMKYANQGINVKNTTNLVI